MKSSILLLLLFIAFTCGQKCFELNETHSWSRGYTGLINVQADQLTTEWNLVLEFSDPPLSFKTWKGNTVSNESTYNITNKCYNGVIYSSQCLSIDYIVRHGYKDPPTIDQVTFNGDILPSCTQPLICEVVNSSEAAGCESCSKCPSAGVEGGYETYDHATAQFSQLWGNISNFNTPVLNGSSCSNATCEALEASVAKLQDELAQIKDAITALESPVVFNCAYMGGDVDTSTTRLAPYTCDVNEGSAMDATTGIFTAPKAGKYRLTFMALTVPLDQKKVTCALVKTSSGIETKIARSVAQTKNGKLEEQITTTIDIIHGFQNGDTVQVAIDVKSGAKIVGDPLKTPQVIFTGQFIRS